MLQFWRGLKRRRWAVVTREAWCAFVLECWMRSRLSRRNRRFFTFRNREKKSMTVAGSRLLWFPWGCEIKVKRGAHVRTFQILRDFLSVREATHEDEKIWHYTVLTVLCVMCWIISTQHTTRIHRSDSFSPRSRISSSKPEIPREQTWFNKNRAEETKQHIAIIRKHNMQQMNGVERW